MSIESDAIAHAKAVHARLVGRPARPTRTTSLSSKREREVVLPPPLPPSSFMGQRIIVAVSRNFDVSIEDVTGSGKDKKLVVARHMAILLFFRKTKRGPGSIANRFGMDQSSAKYASSKMARQIALDETLQEHYNQICRILSEDNNQASIPAICERDVSEQQIREGEGEDTNSEIQGMDGAFRISTKPAKDRPYYWSLSNRNSNR